MLIIEHSSLIYKSIQIFAKFFNLVGHSLFSTLTNFYFYACELLILLSNSRVNCSVVQLFATPWTVAHQTPLSMEFSRQEPWDGLPCPSAGDLPDPRIKLASSVSPALQAVSLPPEPWGKPLLFKALPNHLMNIPRLKLSYLCSHIPLL